MKIRSGFVSNSSSSSFLIDFGKEIESVDDLDDVVNSNFMDDFKEWYKEEWREDELPDDLKNFTIDDVKLLLMKFIEVSKTSKLADNYIEKFLKEHDNGKDLRRQIINVDPIRKLGEMYRRTLGRFWRIKRFFINPLDFNHISSLVSIETSDSFYTWLINEEIEILKFIDTIENRNRVYYLNLGNDFTFGDGIIPSGFFTDKEIHLIWLLEKESLFRQLFKDGVEYVLENEH